MIKLDFREPQPRFPHGCLRVELLSSDISDDFQAPLKFQVFNNIDNSLKWQVELNYQHWAEWYEPPNTTTVIYDNVGKLIKKWYWDTFIHGDVIHKRFLDWCIKNPLSRGIAIGTNDGTTGEWVYPVSLGLTDAILVEASDSTFDKLKENWKYYNNVKFERNLITTTGGECIFYESDDSATNTVSKDQLDRLKSNQEIKEIKKNSISLNDLVIKYNLQNELSWLHLDVEGLDDELVMSMDDNKIKLPEIIIYESLNLSEERKTKVINWLKNKNYDCIESNWNTMAIKN